MTLKLNWDVQHTLIMIGSTVGGALLAYFQAQPAESLIDALSSWQTAKPMLIGAACAAVTALLALAKQTFLPTSASGGGRGSIVPMPAPMPKTSDKPEPPAATYVSLVWARRVMVCFALAAMTATTGCAATQQWWQNFQKDPAAQVASFVQYVTGFIQTANTVWAMISPLLGVNSPQANADFNAAMASLTQALGVAQDAVQAALAAQQTNLDLNAVFAPVQDAVARVLNVINTWKSATSASARSIGAAQDTLSHQAAVIARWH